MNLDSLARHAPTVRDDDTSITRLWLLRLLVRLNGGKGLAEHIFLEERTLGSALGWDADALEESEPDDKAFRARLVRLHRRAENAAHHARVDARRLRRGGAPARLRADASPRCNA